MPALDRRAGAVNAVLRHNVAMTAGDAVLVHGAGGGAWEWNIWARVLRAAGWRVIAPDLVPVPAGLAATTLADYVAQLRAAAAGLQAPVLIGASLGGLIAALCADTLDGSALVLINPIPPVPFAARLPASAPYPEVIAWGSEATLARTRAAMPDADDAACLYAFRHWRDESGAVVNSARAGVAIAKPRCPVLMLASENDTDVPPALTAEFALSWSASLDRIAGASHVGPLLGRSAARCAESVLAWLALARLGRGDRPSCIESTPP